jgi:hypothetical protein
VSYGPADADSTIGADAIVQNWAETHSAFSQVSLEHNGIHSFRVHEGPFVGDWVAYWGVYRAHHDSLDKDVVIPVHSASMLSEGKIVAMVSFFDNMAAALDLGWTLTEPSGTAE